MSVLLRPLHYALSHANVYALIMRLLGAKSGSNRYVAEFMRPLSGERVLDLGCGTARILEHLPEVDYLGADSNQSCIEFARANYGSKGRFVLTDVLSLDPDQLGKFDLVIATGLLHHLDDQQAHRLMAMAARFLSEKGRLITLDGCYEEGQNPLARLALDVDRGRFVRNKEAYLQLVEPHIPQVKANIVRNLLTIPYTHIIMECSKDNLDIPACKSAATALA